MKIVCINHYGPINPFLEDHLSILEHVFHTQVSS